MVLELKLEDQDVFCVFWLANSSIHTVYNAYIYICMYVCIFLNKTINIYLYTKTQNLRTWFSYLTFRLPPQGPLWAREAALGAPKDADLRQRLAQLFEESGGGAIAAAWVSVFFIGTHYPLVN